MDRTVRVRSLVWFCTGAATMLMATLVVTQAWRVDAAPGDTDATLVPITPCRLVDTREPGGAPLDVGEIRTIEAHGTNGPIPDSQCTIPSDAVGLSMNVTAVRASTQTFWTIWPTGQPRPEASSLNPAPGQPPTPNAVTTSLSSSGEFNGFNNKGTVGMVIDVNGYYTNASLQDLAKRVMALEARDSFAVTNSETTDLILTTTPTAYVSVEVTAPVDGQVTLNSTGVVIHSSDGGDIVCALFEAGDIPPTDIVFDTPSLQFWESSLPSDQGTLSGTRTFDIAADATVTYSLACEVYAGSGAIWVGNLTAIFTPAP